NQKSLSVATHVVGEKVLRRHGLPPVGLKQRHWCAGLKAGAGRNRDCRDLSVRRHIKQFLAVAAPLRLLPSRVRHLPLAIDAGKWRHVDLHVTGLIRGIRHPTSIRRELRTAYGPLALKERGGPLRPRDIAEFASFPD